MLLTIINGDLGDDKVIFNGEEYSFPLDDYIDSNIWAVHTVGGVGEIEYRDGTVEATSDIHAFSKVVDHCKELRASGIALSAGQDRDVAYQIARKTSELVVARDRYIADTEATVEVGGVVWQVDPSSSKLLMDAIALYGVTGSTPVGFEWRDYNNVNHPASLALLTDIATARAEQVNQAWRTSWFLKDQAKKATTIEQVEAISWPEAI